MTSTRRNLARVAVTATGAAVAVMGAVTAGAEASGGPQARPAAISCDTRSSGRPAAFYDGPSASYAYDSRFGGSAGVPHLATHTPQGLATWWNWRRGRDLLLVTSYRDGGDAYIIGIDPRTGKHVGTVAIAESHASAITVSHRWAFVQGRPTRNGQATIRRYRLSALRKAIAKRGVPYVKQEGTASTVYAASFMANWAGHVYAGKFEKNGRGRMHRYRINGNGSLTTLPGSWEVPKKTQGLLVTRNHFVYSTSYGRDKRSNLYVVRQGQTDLDRATLKCFRAPSMSEGIAEHGGSVYLLFESGSHKYARPRPMNVIGNLHRAPLSSLTSMN